MSPGGARDSNQVGYLQGKASTMRLTGMPFVETPDWPFLAALRLG